MSELTRGVYSLYDTLKLKEYSICFFKISNIDFLINDSNLKMDINKYKSILNDSIKSLQIISANKLILSFKADSADFALLKDLVVYINYLYHNLIMEINIRVIGSDDTTDTSMHLTLNSAGIMDLQYGECVMDIKCSINYIK